MTQTHPETLLMTPGPSRVPERVLAAGGRPMIHHRSPEFSPLLESMIEGLRPLFGTRGDILPVHTTGRGGMEASVANLFAPGDEIVACCNGKFGEMWAAIAEAYGLTVHRITVEWGAEIDVDELSEILSVHSEVRAVALVHSDTSTGVLNDIEAVARIAAARDVLVLVDGISSIGGVEFRFDEWGVDVAVTGSQKCLMSSAGLAFVAVSKRAWEAMGRSSLPHWYWDFPAIRETLSGPRPQTPGTTPVHLVLQVAEAVAMIEEEGVADVYKRHREMARLARERAEALGLEPMYPNLSRRSPTLTGIRAPEHLSPAEIRAAFRARGIMVAGGLGPRGEDAFRVGHLGDIRPPDVERTFDVLEDILAEAR